jgi:hypothetical protein
MGGTSTEDKKKSGATKSRGGSHVESKGGTKGSSGGNSPSNSKSYGREKLKGST